MNMETADAFWFALLIAMAFAAGRFFPAETVVERIVQERIEIEEKNRSIVESARNEQAVVLKFRRDHHAMRPTMN